MDKNVPYMIAAKNVSDILTKMQNAGVPDAFGHDFLRDLGFTSSNDRGIVKVLKYLGMLDASGKPTASYREFTNHTKSRFVLADRIRTAFDDLYLTDKMAHDKTSEELKGWFKSKTGSGDAVATKIASTFKALAGFADFSRPMAATIEEPKAEKVIPEERKEHTKQDDKHQEKLRPGQIDLGLVYRLEIHLPDTQNVETYRAIFRALREEMMD